jgi:hypothetical protein
VTSSRALVAAAAGLLLVGIAPAHAASVSPLSPQASTVQAGKRALVMVTLTDPVRECRLTFRRNGRTVRASGWTSVTRSQLTWKWTVPSRARSLTWVLRATCKTDSGARSVNGTLRVRGSERGLRSAAAHTIRAVRSGVPLRAGGQGSLDDGVIPSPTPVAPTPPPIRNRYPDGECTWWADQMRPEVTLGSHGLDAYMWQEWAQNHGFRVDQSPVAGDLAVWGRWEGGSHELGHVAYVERVDAGGVYISEMNWNDVRTTSYRYLMGVSLTAARYIHRKP